MGNGGDAAKAVRRARNTRNQANRRRKLKDREHGLKKEMEGMQERLWEATARWRALREQRRCLLQSADILPRPATPHPSPADTPASSSSPAPCAQMASKPAAVLTMSDLEDHLPHPIHRIDRHELRQLLYESATKHYRMEGEQTGVAVEELERYVQVPLPGSSLTYIATTWTPESSLSMLFCYLVLSLEGSFLLEQHRFLRQQCSAQPHSIHTDAVINAPPPHKPDTTALARMRMCSGKGTEPAVVVVAGTLRAMLKRYHARLPHSSWLRVCKRGVDCAATAARVSAQVTAQPPTQQRGTQSDAPCTQRFDSTTSKSSVPASVDSAQSTKRELLPAGGVAMMQYSAWLMHRDMTWYHLKEEANLESESVEDVEIRMVELTAFRMAAVDLTSNAVLMHIRRMKAALATDDPYHLLQVQQQHMVLYNKLQLTEAQKVSMAERWHAWCRQRQHLSVCLNAAHSLFHALPLHPPSVADPFKQVPPSTAELPDADQRSAPRPLEATSGPSSRPAGAFTTVQEARQESEEWHAYSQQTKFPCTVAAEPSTGGGTSTDGPTRSTSRRLPDVLLDRLKDVLSESGESEACRADNPASDEQAAFSGDNPANTAAGRAANTEERLQRMLGESGGVLQMACVALGQVCSVHERDASMQSEIYPFFWDLTAVQHTCMLASFVEGGLPNPGMLQLAQMAAADLHHADVFRDIGT